MALPQAQIPWETRLSTVGESAIKSRLAYFSNPTKYEEDAGIDFYCELIEDDSASIPFYVQAKGAGHFDNSWGRGIPKSTITYWLQQQHPVFLIVYEDETRTCYWMPIEDYRYSLIQKIFTTESKTIYIKMDRSNILEQSRDGNKAFITKVKEDSNSVQLFRGRPQFIGDEYVKKIPPSPRSNAELQQIRETVRACLYSLIQHYLAEHDWETANTYCEFLAEFDKSHFNHFVWLGNIAKALGRTEIAKERFEQALQICRADKNWPRDSMERIIASIENEMRDL
jgi:tetratricopeptide (TPR) repeat protein